MRRQNKDIHGLINYTASQGSIPKQQKSNTRKKGNVIPQKQQQQEMVWTQQRTQRKLEGNPLDVYRWIILI